MKLSKMILLLQEQYKKYWLKHGVEPILFIGEGGICLAAKKVKSNGYNLYKGPFMKLPKSISRALEIVG